MRYDVRPVASQKSQRCAQPTLRRWRREWQCVVGQSEFVGAFGQPDQSGVDILERTWERDFGREPVIHRRHNDAEFASQSDVEAMFDS